MLPCRSLSPLVVLSYSHTTVFLPPIIGAQIVSVLLNESSASSAAGNDADFAGNNGTLDLLGNLANAVASGAEAGEEVDEVSAGSLKLQVRMTLAPLAGGCFATVSVGQCPWRSTSRICLSLRRLRF